eukprot:SAG31_NODE_236_length_19594_cov_7.018620_14_plen_74_part_00
MVLLVQRVRRRRREWVMERHRSVEVLASVLAYSFRVLCVASQSFASRVVRPVVANYGCKRIGQVLLFSVFQLA